MRRLLKIIVILAIIYFIYRRINPSGAQDLTNRLVSARESVVDRFQEDQETPPSQTATTGDTQGPTQTPATDSGQDSQVFTGTISSTTTSQLDYIDPQSSGQQTGTSNSDNIIITPKPSTATTTTKTHSASSASSKGLSNQDYADLRALLQNLVE